MLASVICVLLAFIALASAQTTLNLCLPGKYCTNVAAIAGRYATAQACINACPAGTWPSYAVGGTGWCGCATSCATQVVNPDTNTYCPTTPKPTAKPTANPTAKPTATPTAKPTALDNCHPGKYCSYDMVVYPGAVPSPQQCGTLCAGYNRFSYVASSGWCGCAPSTKCSLVGNDNGVNTYCQ